MEKVKETMPERLYINAGLTPEQKAMAIVENALDKNEASVRVNHDQDEIIELKNEAVEITTEIKSLEDELALVSKDYKDKIKKLKEQQSSVLISIRDGFSYERMMLYKLAKGNLIGYYDSEGNLREWREKEKQERQTRIESEAIFEDMTMHE
jgi:hypothetical protein